MRATARRAVDAREVDEEDVAFFAAAGLRVDVDLAGAAFLADCAFFKFAIAVVFLAVEVREEDVVAFLAAAGLRAAVDLAGVAFLADCAFFKFAVAVVFLAVEVREEDVVAFLAAAGLRAAVDLLAVLEAVPRDAVARDVVFFAAEEAVAFFAAGLRAEEATGFFALVVVAIDLFLPRVRHEP